MGGSGGGGFFSGGSKPDDLRRQVREAESRAQNDNFEISVSHVIDNLLTDINKRDVEAIKGHLDEINKALDMEIDGSVSLIFGGSVAKHTYINGLSDIDALVMLNKSELKDMTPSEVLRYFADRVRERFPNTAINSGTLTVTISFSDAEIQLLPSIKDRSGIRIPKSDGSAWSPIVKPDKFATKLKKVNQDLNGKLIPTIKLAKSILSQIPENQQLSGYHVESIAIKVFEGYNGLLTTKNMLRHFFSEAPTHIRQPIKDLTGQSIHVDDYLGTTGSLQRRIVADSVDRISRCIQNADGAMSLDQWEEILEVKRK